MPTNTVDQWSSSQYVPGSRPLSLGSVTFASEECPVRLPIGAGSQELVILKKQGGGRTVFANGAQPDSVRWTGTFYGTNVQGRVNSLRSYMVAGTEIPISYGNETYKCKIRNFVPNYAFNDAGYDITIEITSDTNGAFSNVTGTSVDDQITAAASQAASSSQNILTVDPQATDVNNDVTGLQTNLNSSSPISSTNAANFTATLNAAQQALASATAYAATITSAMPQYLDTQQLLNSLTLVASNLTASQQAQSIRVTGGSLYEIAAMKYGDATRAFDLMSANNLSSPYLPSSGQTILYLPPYKSAM